MESLFLIVGIVVIYLIFISIAAYEEQQYKETTYYQVTKNDYSDVKRDKGKYGEYLIYRQLQDFESSGGKFLFNINIPKNDIETTEIDAVLICSKGLFVFESKNFSGWIFGNEMHKDWTQTLPMYSGGSRKERFYNPIMQNAAHIKYLKYFIDGNIPLYSVIVFSDECTLKNVTVKSKDVRVIQLRNVSSTVAQICDQVQADLLTPEQVNSVYNKLYPYTQAPEVVTQSSARKS